MSIILNEVHKECDGSHQLATTTLKHSLHNTYLLFASSLLQSSYFRPIFHHAVHLPHRGHCPLDQHVSHHPTFDSLIKLTSSQCCCGSPQCRCLHYCTQVFANWRHTIQPLANLGKRLRNHG